MTTATPSRLGAERLRAALGTRASRPIAEPPRPQRDALDDLFGGRTIQNAQGTCYLVEWSFPLTHHHGRAPLAEAVDLSDEGIACLTRTPESRAPAAPVFLDTETTGLSGGTGTYVFLIGLGSIQADRVLVRQYLMRDYDEEPAMLEAVAAELLRHDALVTYNGKSFDAPMMETRFVASRREAASLPELHLDLLYPTRRLLRSTLERCALQDVEREVLGYRRDEDIPSWMIPSAYFRYLRERDARLFGAVLEHNRDDILSLVALSGWLDRAFQHPSPDRHSAATLRRVAETYHALGWLERSADLLQAVVNQEPADPDERALAALRLASLLRARGAGSTAEHYWQIASEHATLRVDALVAWAKYLEHVARDFGRARGIVERALVPLQLRASPRDPAAHALRQQLEHRLARVIRRQLRDQQA